MNFLLFLCELLIFNLYSKCYTYFVFPANNLEQYFEELAQQNWTLIPIALDSARKLRNSAENKFTTHQFRPATLSGSSVLETSIRNDSIFWLDNKSQEMNENDSAALLQIQNLSLMLKEYFRIGISEIECHYAVYNEGHFYHKHRDATTQNNKRVFSFVVYLNESWNSDDGGQLVGYSEHQQIFSIEPKMGKMILFNSELEHEVIKTRKIRYSLTGWMRR